MSEKIYSWLLRLFPAKFRAEYGGEALQLFRDRYQHERGMTARIRLWMDLLTDTAVSLPRQYAQMTDGPAMAYPDEVPSFQVIDDRVSPKSGSLALGGLVSLLLVALLIPMTRVVKQRNFFGRVTPSGGYSFVNTAPPRVPAEAFDASDRHKVVEAILVQVKEHYFDREAAQQATAQILASEKAGKYDSAVTGEALAALITKELRDSAKDNHLEVIFLPAAEQTRTILVKGECPLQEVNLIDGGLTVWKLDAFSSVDTCGNLARAVLSTLNNTRALVFDLRENGGGDPRMVMLIASYLFDHPEYMYNPRQGTTEQSWTKSPVPGSRLVNKPLYILTSAKTASAAEQFTYDLRMLKRATVIGETTSGKAHAGTFYRVGQLFGIGVPEKKAINPFSDHDWEGVGVEPHVKVKADDALAEAVRLANSQSLR